MKKIRVFLLGMREYRSMATTSFCHPLLDSYDWGREIAHRITFRKFEPKRESGIIDCKD